MWLSYSSEVSVASALGFSVILCQTYNSVSVSFFFLLPLKQLVMKTDLPWTLSVVLWEFVLLGSLQTLVPLHHKSDLWGFTETTRREVLVVDNYRTCYDYVCALNIGVSDSEQDDSSLSLFSDLPNKRMEFQIMSLFSVPDNACAVFT